MTSYICQTISSLPIHILGDKIQFCSSKKYIIYHTSQEMMQNPICLILSILFLSFSLTLTPVFGDGLFEQKLSASFGDKGKSCYQDE